MNEELLKIKKTLKRKKPKFRRIEKHKHSALPDNWRKPKGHHSKIRRGLKWELKMPKIGRKTPKLLKNFDKYGREIIMIKNADDLKNLNEKKIGVVIAGLGLKKKLIIANKAKDKNLKFLNFKPENIIKKAQEKLSKEKKKKIIKKEAKPEELKKSEKPIKKPAKPKKQIIAKEIKEAKEIKKEEKKTIKPAKPIGKKGIKLSEEK